MPSEPKTWKCVSMRPPLRWMSSADHNIWAAATTCRVTTQPGRSMARAMGSALMAPPRSTAAQMWTCTVRTLPSHA
jgi:hypothetical protein